MANMMTIMKSCLCCFVLFIAGCQLQTGTKTSPVRILFVGNSLIYVGNLPAVFETLSESNGQQVSTEMLVQGGATLTDRVNDSSVRKMLDKHDFDYVVLQERGGDVLCHVHNAVACVSSRRAHGALATLARAHGAKPIVLGTYQQLEAASRAIEESEQVLASQIDALHIPVSERFRAAQVSSKDMHWFNADGMHPGHDLVLLESVQLYSAIFGNAPKAHALTVGAPMYVPRSKFNGSLPASGQASEVPVNGYRYELDRVSEIIKLSFTSSGRGDDA